MGHAVFSGYGVDSARGKKWHWLSNYWWGILKKKKHLLALNIFVSLLSTDWNLPFSLYTATRSIKWCWCKDFKHSTGILITCLRLPSRWHQCVLWVTCHTVVNSGGCTKTSKVKDWKKKKERKGKRFWQSGRNCIVVSSWSVFEWAVQPHTCY